MTDLEYLEIKDKLYNPEKYNLSEENIAELNKTIADYNTELVKQFPFLRPKNRWTGLASDDYDYSYTELDAMPEGWRKAFGIQMCQEIKDALLRAQEKDPNGGYPESYFTTNFESKKIIPYLEGYTITEIKEKFGTLRWYDNGAPKEVDDIVSKYEYLSEDTCINCGKPAEYCTEGWIIYLCKDCFDQYIEHYPDDKQQELYDLCKIKN